MIARTSPGGLSLISVRSLTIVLAVAALLFIGGVAGVVLSTLPHATTTSSEVLPARAPAEPLHQGGPR